MNTHNGIEVVKCVGMLDADDTTVRTKKILAFCIEIIERTLGPRVAEKAERDSRGRGFDLMHWLGGHGVDIEGFSETILAEIDDEKRQKLVYGDVLPFFEAAESAGIVVGTCTKGGVENQKLKLQIAGILDRPYIITDRADKTRMYGDWLDRKTGLYRVQFDDGRVVKTKQIFHVGDRVKEFEGIPFGMRGYLMHRGDLPDDRVQIPPSDLCNMGLITVRSLHDVARAEGIAMKPTKSRT